MKLGIFVSSPGDVSDERIVARQVLERLRGEFSGRIDIETLFWEDEPLLSTGTFQQQIPRASSYNIVVCVLCSRLGTPIRGPDGVSYNSGTEFEFLDAWNSFHERGTPDLMVYKSARVRQPEFKSLDDAHEWFRQNDMLRAFIDQRLKNPDGTFKAAFHGFESPAQFEEKLETHLRKLILKRLPEGGDEEEPALVTWADRSPFRGLLPFDVDHSPVFFGRTAAIAGIKDLLVRQADAGCAFALVTGMSGCGKSSVLQAGVLPLLMQPGVVRGVDVWRRCQFRPAQTPGDLFGGLARALLEPQALPELAAAGFSAAPLAALLRDASETAIAPIRGALGQAATKYAQDESVPHEPRARLILVVDQLEELFTTEGITPALRTTFVHLLAALSRSGDVWVLATLRSDFFHRLGELPELSSLPQTGGQFNLVPPTPNEIGQMIRFPSRAAGLRFERRQSTGERLDDVLQKAAENDPQALPLLEFVLDELYTVCGAQRLLTFEAYGRLGGLEGALAQRAEEVLAGLPAAVQAELPAVLRALVTIESDGHETVAAARVPLERVGTSPERESLARALVEARLLTTDQGEDGRPVVRLVHEALLRHWPRLQKWLADDREFLRVRSRVAEAARRWEFEQRHVDLLLPEGKPLAEAVDLLQKRKAEIDPELVSFIDASRRRARSHRIRRRVAVSSTVALVFALVATFALHASRQARLLSDKAGELEKALAHSQELQAEANDARVAAIEGRESAERAEAAANEQTEIAQKEKEDADRQREIAEQQKEIAEKQKEIAEKQKELAEKQRGLALNFADKTQLFLGEQAKLDPNREWLYADVVDHARDLADELLKASDGALPVRYFKMYLLSSALESRMRLEQYKHAYEDSRQAVSLAEGLLQEQLDADNLRRTVDALAGAARMLKEFGENQQALNAAQRAVDTAARLRIEGDSHAVEAICGAWTALGEAQGALEHNDEAQAAFRKSLEIAQEAFVKTPGNVELEEAVAAAHIRLGRWYRARDDYEQSEKEIGEGKDLRLTAWNRKGRNLWHEVAQRRRLADAFEQLGFTQKARREWSSARSSFQNVFNVHESLAKYFKHDDSWFPVAQAELRLAELERDRGNEYDSVAQFKKALATISTIVQTSPTQKHRRFAATVNMTLGDLHQDYLDDFEAARECFREALRLRELVLGESTDALARFDVADTHRTIGALEFDRQDPASALPEAELAAKQLRELVKDRPTTKHRGRLAQTLNLLGLIHKQAGRYDASQQAFAEELALREALAAEASDASSQLDVAVAHKEIARLHLAAGRPGDARQAFEKALEIESEVVKRDASVFYAAYRSVLLAGRAVALAQLGLKDESDRDFADALRLLRELEESKLTRLKQLDLIGRYGALAGIVPDGLRLDVVLECNERRVAMLRKLAADASDIVAQRRLTSALGSLAWWELLNKQPARAMDHAREALRRDSKQIFVVTNLAHGQLFSGDLEGAQTTYEDCQDRMVRGHTFAWWVLDDFRRMRTAGVTYPGMDKIETLMQPHAK